MERSTSCAARTISASSSRVFLSRKRFLRDTASNSSVRFRVPLGGKLYEQDCTRGQSGQRLHLLIRIQAGNAVGCLPDYALS